MREIKFRFWMILEGNMVSDLRVNGHHSINSQFNGDAFVAIPMQYTGLKDKNGKEIYEGDIVSYERQVGIPPNLPFKTFITQVIFDGGWYLSNRFGNIKEVGHIFPLEVIGNIYENPELLENLHGN